MLALMYDKSTGEIRSIMRGSKDTIALNGDYVEITEFLEDYHHYKIVDGKVVEKNEQEMADVVVTPPSQSGLGAVPASDDSNPST